MRIKAEKMVGMIGFVQGWFNHRPYDPDTVMHEEQEFAICTRRMSIITRVTHRGFLFHTRWGKGNTLNEYATSDAFRPVRNNAGLMQEAWIYPR